MPFLFLSPSTQSFNPYVTTENEQYWMNRLADEMVPYLHASGINVVRNDPTANAAASIRQSNAGEYDFHLALHSNASPEDRAGSRRGVEFYYAPGSEAGLRMANILADEIEEVYPLEDDVRVIPTTTIGEVRRTRAPSVLAELGYHDNVDDANWLTENLQQVARALSEGVAEYFDVPFITPQTPRAAQVRVNSGNLNIRERPSTDAPILTTAPNGASLQILGTDDGWSTVEYNGLYGFAASRYLST